MAGYDTKKDKVLEEWESPETGLVITVNSYDSGEAKVQIGPRLITKKDGTQSRRKTGRLKKKDWLWLSTKVDEITEKLQSYHS